MALETIALGLGANRKCAQWESPLTRTRQLIYLVTQGYDNLKQLLPSESVLTVWGSLADFIIAVKVMISVRSNRLQPVQRPFIKRIRCFYRAERGRKLVYKSMLCLFKQAGCTPCSDQKVHVWPERLHMLHQDFPDAAMRIQSILYMLQLLTAADFWGLKCDRKIIIKIIVKRKW